MFKNIEPEFSDRYTVKILSTDPWVVTFDNFLTDVEINALITTVNGKWERSTDTGKDTIYFSYMCVFICCIIICLYVFYSY